MMQRIISLFLFVFLVGCGQTTTQPVQSPITPAPSLIATNKSTISPSFTPALPTRTPKPSPTPLPTPKPYLIKLVEGAGDGVDEMYTCIRPVP